MSEDDYYDNSPTPTRMTDTTERSIPDEQKEVSDEQLDADSRLQTMERAQELSAHYEKIKDNTIDDSTVYGKVKSINTSTGSKKIVVDIDLPAKGTVKECRFDKPKVWSDDYRFVRWIRYYGYDADSFPSMLEDKCKVEVETDGGKYDLYIPQQRKYRKKITEAVRRPIQWYFNSPILLSPFLLFGWAVHSIAAVTNLIQYSMSWIQFTGTSALSLLLIGIMMFAEEVIKNNE